MYWVYLLNKAPLQLGSLKVYCGIAQHMGGAPEGCLQPHTPFHLFLTRALDSQRSFLSTCAIAYLCLTSNTYLSNSCLKFCRPLKLFTYLHKDSIFKSSFNTSILKEMILKLNQV